MYRTVLTQIFPQIVQKSVNKQIIIEHSFLGIGFCRRWKTMYSLNVLRNSTSSWHRVKLDLQTQISSVSGEILLNFLSSRYKKIGES